MNISTFKSGLALTGVAACIAFASANVQAASVDLGQLQAGVTYEFPGFSDVQGFYVVDQDGMVQVQYTGTEIPAFIDSANENEIQGSHAYVNGKPTRTFSNLKKDDVLYFHSTFTFDPGTITILAGEIALKLEESYPSTDPSAPEYYGGAFSITGDARISLGFNLPVAVANCTLSANGTFVRLNPNVAGTRCEIEPAAALMNMYKAGSLKGGDVVTVSFTGVTEAGNADNKLNGDGVLDMKFTMAPQPIQLVSTTNTPDTGMPVMLSYYLPDNPKAIVSATFSGDLNSEWGKMPIAQITYGDMDYMEADMYIEELIGHVEGNTVYFNLANKLRRPEDMCPDLPADRRPNFISFVIKNIYDTTGQRAYIPSISNPTTIPFTYNLETLAYNVASDFTPRANAGLTEGQEMEIFIMDGAALQYDGVLFKYQGGGREMGYVVGMPEVTIVPDEFAPETDLSLKLKVPALPSYEPETPVTVTLSNLMCADGLDHSAEVSETYASYTATSAGFDWNSYLYIYPSVDEKQYSLYDLQMITINYGSNAVALNDSKKPFLTNDATGEVVNADAVAIPDPSDYDAYLVRMVFPALPAFGNYTLTLPAGMLVAEGQFSPELTFNYEVVDPYAPVDYGTLELISVTPAEGSALEAPGTRDGLLYTIDTNLNDKIASFEVEWLDVTDPENPESVAWTSGYHFDDEGEIMNTPLSFTKISVGGDEMYTDRKYQMVVTCFNAAGWNKQEIGVIRVDYKGATPAYVYSDLKLINVTPNPEYNEIESENDLKFTVTYSGPVTLNEDFCFIPLNAWENASYESIVPNDDNTQFTFTIPAWIPNSYNTVNCYVVALDAEGRAVLPDEDWMQYQNGQNNQAGVLLEYISTMAQKELTVSPAGGVVEQLDRFRVSCNLNGTDMTVQPSWLAYPYVMDAATREVLYRFNLEDDKEEEEAGWDDPVRWIDMILPEAITEPGKYALVIPANAFTISYGFAGDSFNSKYTVIGYTIEGESDVVYDLYPVSFDPAPGMVEEIEKVKVTFPEDVDIALWDAYLYDENGEVVSASTIDWNQLDYYDMQNYFLDFWPPVTEAGTYTLVIPRGTFGDFDFIDSYGKMGRASEEIRETYVIAAVGVNDIIADGARADVFDVTGKVVLRNASAADVRNLDKGVYIINGKKVVLK